MKIQIKDIIWFFAFLAVAVFAALLPRLIAEPTNAVAFFFYVLAKNSWQLLLAADFLARAKESAPNPYFPSEMRKYRIWFACIFFVLAISLTVLELSARFLA